MSWPSRFLSSKWTNSGLGQLVQQGTEVDRVWPSPSDQFLQISPPLVSKSKLTRGGLISRMSKTSKIFRAFGADLRYFPMFYMFFVSKIVVFRSFPWFFVVSAAPETLSTHSISFRSNKHKSNTTVQNSGSSPAGVENHLNIDIQLIRRRRRENFGFLASKTQFSYWKTPFLQRSETFLESKSLKNGQKNSASGRFPK